MTKWEVTFVTSQIITWKDVSDIWTKKVNKDGTTTFDVVSNYAEKGWELVSVTPIIAAGDTRQILFTFKRPIQNL